MSLSLKKPALLTLLLFIGWISTGNAQYHHGFGARFGTTTGLTAKYWFDNKTGLDATLSYRLNSFATIDASYLFHYRGLVDEYNFFPFVGFGGFLGKSSADDKQLVRRFQSWYGGGLGKVGIAIPVRRIDIAFEAGGRTSLFPEIWGEWFLDLVIRYWL